jgi:hypothetical protein
MYIVGLVERKTVIGVLNCDIIVGVHHAPLRLRLRQTPHTPLTYLALHTTMPYILPIIA